MQRLKWFLIGITVTAFSSDYISMKSGWNSMAYESERAVALVERVQATNTTCLIELAYRKSMIESWETKAKLTTLAQVDALNSIDRAREGDAEAVLALKDLGYSISGPGKRLAVLRGIGGPIVDPSHK